MTDAKQMPVPEDLQTNCSNCSGKGFVDSLSFSDPATVIQKSCRVCSGKGWLWALDQQEMAERIARLESELDEHKNWKEGSLERLQDICEEHGCPAGWHRLDFLRDYLRMQKKEIATLKEQVRRLSEPVSDANEMIALVLNEVSQDNEIDPGYRERMSNSIRQWFAARARQAK